MQVPALHCSSLCEDRSSRYLLFPGGSVPSVVITGVSLTTTGDMLSMSVRYLVEPQHPFSPFTSNLVDVLDHHKHNLVETVWRDRMFVHGDRLPLSRPGPQGNQQQLPDQVQQQPGPPLLHLHHGAPPLRPVHNAAQQQRQPDPVKRV